MIRLRHLCAARVLLALNLLCPIQTAGLALQSIYSLAPEGLFLPPPPPPILPPQQNIVLGWACLYVLLASEARLMGTKGRTFSVTAPLFTELPPRAQPPHSIFDVIKMQLEDGAV